MSEIVKLFKKFHCKNRTPSEPLINFKEQNFEFLLAQHNSENLFEDPEFPADFSSLTGFGSDFPTKEIIWKRPTEVMYDPEFVINGYGRCDMDQGYLGNCWFIAACVGIMQDQKLFSRVVPQNQSFKLAYSGIFHFQFWLYGQWISVVIDDRLPFFKSTNQLVFCHNKQEPNELWGSLLEKAYAKLHGSYSSLESGQTYDALIDMSAGIQESIDIQKMVQSNETDQLWTILLRSYQKKAIICCSILPDPDIKEARLTNGLVKGHAFTLTNVALVNLDDSAERVLRIRNPWGDNVEWNGDWSDRSEMWNRLSEDLKKRIEYVPEADGEFWMNFSDFIANFDTVQMCHLNPDSYIENEFEVKEMDGVLAWKTEYYHSAWSTEKGTAGGRGDKVLAEFWSNPQFLIHLLDHDLEDKENKASLLVALMQKNTRLKRNGPEYIQFRLYKIKDGIEMDETKNSRTKFHASQLERIGGSGGYINSREVTMRFKLKPGYYLIIPSTYDKNRDAEFMLRVFTEKPIEISNLEEEFEDPEELADIGLGDEDDLLLKNWISILNPDSYEGKKLNDKISKKECALM